MPMVLSGSSKEEQAKVDRAIDKGVAFLKGSQTEAGDWKGKLFENRFLVGQCALPAYALLECGVPADDPAIKKAAEYIRTRILATDQTYEISLGILFFDRLGDPQDEKLIQILALRLIAGQQQDGGWCYHCLNLSKEEERELLVSLASLNKRIEDGKKGRAQALGGIKVTASLQSLTVFQSIAPFVSRGRRKAPDDRFITCVSDNSNSQFALLGLWVAGRRQIPVKPTFEIMVEYFERSQNYPSGRWYYCSNWVHPNVWVSGLNGARSMVCVGLLGLAIGRGLNLLTPGSVVEVENDIHILRGLAALQGFIGNPSGNLDKRVPLYDLYSLWSVERVGVLYNLPTIGGKDWYRWGSQSLLTNQLKNGDWPAPSDPAEAKGRGYYKQSLSTAFALLFLKRSHPMKDLTNKLPFTAKQLNEGISRLSPKDKFPVRPVAAPSQSRSLETTTTVPKSDKKP